MDYDIEAFSDPWEHIRLLSDATRNHALVELLRRRAPGNRVLEVGCGSGVFAVLAAKLGASRVTAVEPTDMVDVARELADRNKVDISFLQGRIEDLDPSPHDLVYAELLNADPFVEGLVDAMMAASTWVAPGGHLAPHRLRIHASLCTAELVHSELRSARRNIQALENSHGLDLGPLHQLLATEEATRLVTATEVPAGPSVVAWDLELGQDEPEDVELELTVSADTQVGGVLIWFEAILDEDLAWQNAPGHASHWGQLLCAWSTPRTLHAGESMRVGLELDDTEIDATVVD